MNGIPMAIYRSWISRDLPAKMAETVRKTMAASPEFDQYLYSDADCLKFLEDNFEPNVAKAFRCLKPGAYQSDLWRYCILYKLGGVYIDIKLVAKFPVKDILVGAAPILVKDLRGQCADGASGFWNGIMAAPPGEAFFKACIDEIVKNCKERFYGTNSLDITGPCMMARIASKGLYDKQLLQFKVEEDTNRIYLGQREFAEEYKGYQEDQTALQKTPRYGELWNNRDVFDTSIEFD